MNPEFRDRPTLREWKRYQRQLRWQTRLARAPHYQLGTILLLLLSATLVALFALAGTTAR
jgi:hypothetical protein